MVNLNDLIEPENVTDPTLEEYMSAYRRIVDLANRDHYWQTLRDLETVRWYGWNRAYHGLS